MESKDETLREAACIGDLESVTALIQQGTDVNGQNQINGMTPLHWAACRGHPRVVNFLLCTGADPCLKRFDCKTPADLATNPDVLELLTDRLRDKQLAGTCSNSAEVGDACQSAAGVGQDECVFVPNYRRNPEFPYSANSSLGRLKNGTQATDSLEASSRMRESLLLKVRVADDLETDFCEFELPPDSQTYTGLVCRISEELCIEQQCVCKLRKLPNVRIRNDADVARLRHQDEIEVVR